MDRDERASPVQQRMRWLRLRCCPVQRREDMEYRYPHFKRSLHLEDTSFHNGVAPGHPLPDFDLQATDGSRIRKSDAVGWRPLLLTFGSIT
jgi:hypothetical protein